MVELKHLWAGYEGVPVLRDVSLSFPPGQVTALLGPNGCGKSTLLKASLGSSPSRRGRVLLDGEDLSALSPRQVAQKAAYLAQSRSVPSITAGRMVLHGRFPYLSYPRRYRKEDYEMARRALQWADAADLAQRPWTASAAASGRRSTWPWPWLRTPRAFSWTSPPPSWTSATSWR